MPRKIRYGIAGGLLGLGGSTGAGYLFAEAERTGSEQLEARRVACAEAIGKNATGQFSAVPEACFKHENYFGYDANKQVHVVKASFDELGDRQGLTEDQSRAALMLLIGTGGGVAFGVVAHVMTRNEAELADQSIQ